MSSKETVFFTGGAGFIGLHVVPMLLEQDYKVRIFDNMFRGDRDAVAALGDEVELIDQDVRYGGAVHARDEGLLHVIHARGGVDQQEPVRPVRVHRHQHGRQPQRVRRRRRPRRRPPRLRLPRVGLRRPGAPADARGRQAPPASRRTASPSAPARTCSATTSGAPELSWIALRFFNVYGPGQKTTAYYTSVINHFVNRLRNGEPPVIDGKGEQSMDFIHVHDIARSVVLALESEQANVPVNVGTGIDTSIADLARDPHRRRRRRRRAAVQPPRRARQPPCGRHHPRQGGPRLRADDRRAATGMTDLIRRSVSDGEPASFPPNPYNPHAWIIGEPTIGEGTWIGAFTVIDGSGGLTIGARLRHLLRRAHLHALRGKRCVSGRRYADGRAEPGDHRRPRLHRGERRREHGRDDRRRGGRRRRRGRHRGRPGAHGRRRRPGAPDRRGSSSTDPTDSPPSA